MTVGTRPRIGGIAVPDRYARLLRTASLAWALASALLACSPAEEPGTTAETGDDAGLVIETVELGLGFDEPITLGGLHSESPSTSATLLLEQADAGSDAFAGRVTATDGAGNTADLRVEVRVEREADEP
jgi:hypothetical protein